MILCILNIIKKYFTNMFKSATTTMFGLLLIVSLIMLISSSFNLNIFSNAMAVILNPHLDSITLSSPSNEPYGEAKSNYYQLPQKQQQQQQEEYQKDTNTYDNNAYTDNNSYNRNYDDYDNYNSNYPGKSNYDSLKIEGTFFVSDAGESHGGFEFTAEYKTEFDVTNGIGTLTITQVTGLGDPLEKHVYSITDLKIKENNKITMNIDEYPVELIFVQSNVIWNHQFDNNYIASWGDFAPENEIKGMISPIIFPGLPDFWYVELRIPTAY